VKEPHIKADIVKLSIRDQNEFIHTLLNPPKPNKKMLEAKERYEKITISCDG
jgi:uncharacterized protein (DUF1778 family)